MGNNDFEQALAFTLRWEGGYVNHPADKGGATNKGVTQNVYDAYRSSRGVPIRPVEWIEADEVKEIYYRQYWLAGKCDQLPAPVNIVHFDACVNHGLGNAVKRLQAVAGVVQDGGLGPMTIAAVQKTLAQPLALDYIAERTKFYYAIVKANPSQGVFLAGWLNRMASLELEISG